MARSTRVVSAVVFTLLLVGAASTFLAFRARHALSAGSAGLSYTEKTATKRPTIFGLKAGHILMVDPNGAARKAGLRRGDEILSINGVELTDRKGLARVNDLAGTGSVVTYRIRRNGVVSIVPLRLENPFTDPRMVAYAVAHVFVATCFLATGLFVFVKKPDDRRVVVYFAMMVAGAVAVLGNATLAIDNAAVSLRGIYVDPGTSLLPLFVWLVFGVAFAPLTLHMALVFPRDRPILRDRPGVLRLVYGIPAAAILMTLLMGGLAIYGQRMDAKGSGDAIDITSKIFLGVMGVSGMLILFRIVRASRTEGFKNALWSRPIQSLWVLFGILAGLTAILLAFRLKGLSVAAIILTIVLPYLLLFSFPVLACISLYRSYQDSGVEERRQVKWPLWGVLIALSVRIFFAVFVQGLMAFVLYRGYDIGNMTDWSVILLIIPVLAYLLIPVSFAFAILKYRLMNIDVIIKKTVAYAILSGAIIILYLVLVGGLGTLLVNVAGVKNTTTVIGSTLVVAALFVPLRNKLQSLVDRNLFRQKYDYPQALRAISADTMGARDLAVFLGSATEKLQQALQNRAVVVFAPRGSDFVATAKVGVPDNILGTQRVSAGTVASFDRPLDPRRRTLPETDAAALKKIDAALVVPVRSQGEARSLLALAPKLSDREFDLEDIEFISSAADQIAIGIDRIRTQLDEADFDQARRMQQTLLPAEPPAMSGLDVAGIWQPARAVGGDYYDLLKLSETRLAVCIGDVAGKGMPAALLMSGLQAAVRASATEEAAPSEVVERVRRVVVPSLGGRFVTFFYCVIDTAAHTVRYCNAGHNQPIVVRADGTTLRLLAGSPILSRLFKAAPLLNGELELNPGDRLVLFTDGVSEARDGGENEFGEDRLAEFVAAHRETGARELASQIAAEVSAFSGGRADDDLTLVAVVVS